MCTNMGVFAVNFEAMRALNNKCISVIFQKGVDVGNLISIMRTSSPQRALKRSFKVI